LQRSLSESQTQDELIIDNAGGQVQLRLLQSASQYALTFVSLCEEKEIYQDVITSKGLYLNKSIKSGQLKLQRQHVLLSILY
jgi:hypothetical protein